MNFQQTNTQSTSLFGNQTGNTQSSSLFGNNNNSNQNKPLFGNSTTNVPLFGNSNINTNTNSSNVFNVFNNNNNQPFSVLNNPNPQNPNFSFNNQINMISKFPSKNEMDENEITYLLKNFLASLDTSNPANIFKYFLYSKLPQNVDPRTYQSYIPYFDDGEGNINLVDYNLWKKATQQNPNPNKYFPIQISSPKQFLIRLRKTEVDVLIFLEQIIKMQKNLENMNNKEQKEINKELQLAREKVKKIKNLITLVSTELAQISLKTGKYVKDFNIEKKIDDKLKSINEKVNSDSDIKRKIAMLKNIPVETAPFPDGDPNYIKGMSKGRVERNLSALKELKNVLDIQFNNLKKNMKIVQGIQNDLNKMNLNGNLN